MFATFEWPVTFFLLFFGIGVMLKKIAEALSTPVGQQLLERFTRRPGRDTRGKDI